MSSSPSAVQAILELFQGPLADVRFADVDANGLVSLAAEVERAAAAVQEQEAHLAALRLALSERQEALSSLAQRAHSYARVYAENDEALLARLNAISLPRPPKPRKGAKLQPEPSAKELPPEAAAVEAATERASADGEGEAAALPAPVTGRKGKRRGNADPAEASA